VGGFEKSRLWGGCEKNRLLFDLDLHYKYEAVSEKVSKRYNCGCIVTAGISFIK